MNKKDTEVVEYAMAPNTSPAMIADYETKLIPKNVLANKLQQLVEQLSKDRKHFFIGCRYYRLLNLAVENK